MHFTSFSHARNWGTEDAIPKFAFGRFEAQGQHIWMPLSVEVHHGLMDGVHLGDFRAGVRVGASRPGRLGWCESRAPGVASSNPASAAGAGLQRGRSTR